MFSSLHVRPSLRDFKITDNNGGRRCPTCNLSVDRPQIPESFLGGRLPLDDDTPIHSTGSSRDPYLSGNNVLYRDDLETAPLRTTTLPGAEEQELTELLFPTGRSGDDLQGFDFSAL